MPAGPAKSVHGTFAIPSLDGLRAIAVMLVFVGHGFTAPGTWPGDVGVTIFFFLSGYLITTLLRREYDKSGRISLSKFYLRRALRILPPAYIAIALSVIVGLLGWLPSTQNLWGVLSQVFNVTNYYMVATEAATGDQRHGLPPESSQLWSLAVEEHFYLIFPAALILFLWRRLNYRVIGYILLAACVVALIWRTYLWINGASFPRLYISTDTRADGLLFGAATALLWNPALGDKPPFGIPDRIIRRVAAPVAAFVLIAAALGPGGLVVADTVIYACLVPLFWFVISHPQGVTGRWLNSRWMVHIGLLSFSIYLLHRLVIALVGLFVEIAPIADVASLVLTVAVAQLMYVWVETPLGKVRKKFEARLPDRTSNAEGPSATPNEAAEGRGGSGH